MRSYIWDPWRSAELDPERIAVVAGDSARTFGELTGQARRLRRGLRALDVADGAIVATDLPSGPDLFALALAALEGGFGLFPVSRRWGGRLREDALRMAGAVLDVTARPGEGGAVRSRTVAELDAAAGAREAGHRRRADDPRAGYLVFLTSSTTGPPKVVARSRPWYPYRGVAVTPAHGSGHRCGAHVMANPEFHLGTLGPALYALQAGSAVIVQREWSAAGFCALVDSHAADSTFLNPHQLLDLVTGGRAPEHPMKAVLHGGSVIARDVKYQAIDLFGPVVREFYGTSRGVICEVSSEEWLRHPGTVGRPLAGLRLSIRRADGNAAGGEIGHIYARYRALDMTGPVPGYTDTGDLGYLDDAGYLYVLGRAAGDGAGDLALLEQLSWGIRGVVDVAVMPAADVRSVTCYIEYQGAAAGSMPAEIEEFGRRLGMAATVVARPAGFFPRTPSGKLWRARLAAAGENVR
jgi:long-chain acyl-CoA synthetase